MSAPAPRREDLPDGSVRIHFATPIVDIGGIAKMFCTIRQPSAAERWSIGDPRSLIYNDASLALPYVDRDMLLRWVKLLIHDHDADVIGRERDLALATLIEEVILDFFMKARMRLTLPSAPSPTPAQAPANSPA